MSEPVESQPKARKPLRRLHRIADALFGRQPPPGPDPVGEHPLAKTYRRDIILICAAIIIVVAAVNAYALIVGNRPH